MGDVTPDGPRPRRFRLQFWVVLLIYLVAAQVTAAVAWAVLWAALGGPAGSVSPRILLTANWAVLGGLLGGAMWAFARVRVGPDGVEVPRSFGPVAWGAIEEARVVHLFGLPFARLSSGRRRLVRVPLFLADLPGFVAAVEEFAGPDHPLTRTLWEWRDGDEPA